MASTISTTAATYSNTRHVFIYVLQHKPLIILMCIRIYNMYTKTLVHTYNWFLIFFIISSFNFQSSLHTVD